MVATSLQAVLMNWADLRNAAGGNGVLEAVLPIPSLSRSFCEMSSTLFTIGYEKRTEQEYVDLLREAGVDVVIDVRETAWSHKPGFSKSALNDALAAVEIEYVHASFAGNPKHLREIAEDHKECIANFRRYLAVMPEILRELDCLIQSYISLGLSVALTCFERHPGDCHRSILADAWASTSYRNVEHLGPTGCRRLIRA